MSSDLALVQRPLCFGGSNARTPQAMIMLSPGMSDEEVRRALAIVNPPPEPPSKISLMADPDFIEVASILASSLDSVRHRRREARLFVQAGTRDHCNELMRTVIGDDKFDVDRWFSGKRGGDLKYDPRNPLTPIEKVKFTGQMQVDWVKLLLEQEIATPGFCKVLFNCLELERRISERMAASNSKAMGGSLTSAANF